jgi:rhodanese-related sulfurtransferase
MFLLCCAATVSAWEDIDPADAQALVSADAHAYILDVRSPSEYRWNGHCSVPEGQIINIPWWFWEFDRQTDDYAWNDNKFFDAEVYRHFDPATDTLIVVCRSGGRAGQVSNELKDLSQPASNRLEELGFFNIYRMTGGFSFGWEPAGLPVVSNTVGIWKPSDFKGRSLN